MSGWTFVLVVVNTTLLYLGCGAIYNMQQGNPFSFPHVRFWNNLYALVLDGIHFVSSGGKPAPVSGSSGGYAPVPVIVGPEATVSGGTTYASSKGAEETPFIIGPIDPPPNVSEAEPGEGRE